MLNQVRKMSTKYSARTQHKHKATHNYLYSHCLLTDVIQCPSAEAPVELLGSEAAEVIDGVGPQVQHVVPGEGLSLLQHHHLGPQQGQLHGCPQPTWSSPQHQTLSKNSKKSNSYS